MRMTPEIYAQNLMKHHGPGYALAMAESLVQLASVSGSAGGAPFADEVAVQEQSYVDKDTKMVKTKTVMTVDETAKAKRLAKTTAFWKNVAGYLRNRQFKKAA